MEVGAGGAGANVVGWLPSLDVVGRPLVVDAVDSEPITVVDSELIDVVDSEPIDVVDDVDVADELIWDEPVWAVDKPDTNVGDDPDTTDSDVGAPEPDATDSDVGAAEPDTIDEGGGPLNLPVDKCVDVVAEGTDGVNDCVDDEVEDCVDDEVEDCIDKDVATARYHA